MNEIAAYKNDVWGREVLLGVQWDVLWLLLITVFSLLAIHAIVLAILKKQATPDSGGKRLRRHDGIDRAFHWIMAASVIVLMITGILPVVGIKFAWLDLHWISGLILTAVVAFHIIRSLFWQDFKSMLLTPKDLSGAKPGKYSFAQKGMHWAMTVVVLGVIYTGIVLFMQIDSPWWQRTNAMPESELGLMFFLHGLFTLGLVALTATHIYFAVRPEKRFYTRSMIQGWISEDELKANHDIALWSPKEAPEEEASALPESGATAK